MKPVCRNLFGCLILALIVGGIGGCRSSERDLDTETISSRDYVLVQNVFNDAFKQVHQVALYDSVLNDTGLVQLIDTNCLDTFYTTTGLNQFPTTLVLNYGSGNGPACLDGRYRRGEIRARFTSKYTNPNALITITFDDYWVDENKVEGTMTLNGLGNGNYGVTIADGRVFWKNFSNEFDVIYTANLTLERSEGASTLATDDDVFLYTTGVGNGRNSKGNSFTCSITDPLKMDVNCNWMIDGGVRIKPVNLQVRNVDLGSGACDNRIIVNINNREFEAIVPGYN